MIAISGLPITTRSAFLSMPAFSIHPPWFQLREQHEAAWADVGLHLVLVGFPALEPPRDIVDRHRLVADIGENASTRSSKLFVLSKRRRTPSKWNSQRIRCGHDRPPRSATRSWCSSRSWVYDGRGVIDQQAEQFGTGVMPARIHLRFASVDQREVEISNHLALTGKQWFTYQFAQR